jgi:hypothetical protein
MDTTMSSDNQPADGPRSDCRALAALAALAASLLALACLGVLAYVLLYVAGGQSLCDSTEPCPTGTTVRTVSEIGFLAAGVTIYAALAVTGFRYALADDDGDRARAAIVGAVAFSIAAAVIVGTNDLARETVVAVHVIGIAAAATSVARIVRLR